MLKFNLYNRITENTSTTITIREFLNLIQSKEVYQDTLKVRYDYPVPSEYKEAKRMILKAVSITGINERNTGHDENSITGINPLICIDIDRKDNEHLKGRFWEVLRSLPLSPLFNNSMFLQSKSVGGQGVYIVILVQGIESKQHYKNTIRFFIQALKESFDINGDSNATKLNQLRYVSYFDKKCPFSYINTDVKPYDNKTNIFKGGQGETFIPLPVKQTEHQQANEHHKLNDSDKMNELVQTINAQKIDITGTYNDWISIGTAIKKAFGGSGFYYFNEISKHYTNYNLKEVQDKFKEVNPKSTSLGLGFVFKKAKDQGVYLSWCR